MNRIVVITGASRGLGLELARECVGSGDKVFGISRTRRHWAAARRVLPSRDFELLCCNLASETKVKHLLARIVRSAGRIDILVNNAGYCAPLARVEETAAKSLEEHLKQNLMTAFLMCKYTLPVMARQANGFIVNVSSMAGTRAVPRLFPYSASKFGMLALSQAIAKENDGTGLRCVTVCPGGMNTAMRRDLFGDEDAARQQTPGFVADVVLQVIEGKLEVLSGGHIVIRHGKITGIFPPPGA